MIRAIKRLLSGVKQSEVAEVDFYEKDGQLYLGGQVFPASSHFDAGIPAYKLDNLMAHHQVQKLIRDIYQGLPLGDAEFKQLLLPVIRNFAAHAHCLPASERQHHRAPLGLLCHSLQVAVYTMNIARANYFNTGATPRQVRDNEERWHVAAALAGLLHDAGKPLTDYAVMDNHNNRWTTSVPLADWLASNNATRYFLTWSQNRHKLHESATATAANRILTAEIQDYLLLHGREILQDLANFFEGRAASSSLNAMVIEADKLSVSKDLSSNQAIAADGSKAPLELYIFNAIKSLIEKGKWKVNAPGARVLVIEGQGVFLDLEQGGAALGGEIRNLGYAGIPQDPGGISFILSDRGYLVPLSSRNGADLNNWCFQVEFKTAGGVVTQEFNLLKFREGHHILGDLLPAAVQGTLLNAPQKEAPAPVQGEQVSQQSAGTAPFVTSQASQQPAGADDESRPAQSKPRDFEQLMSDLKAIEGEHQPDLEQEEPVPEPSKPDPVAEIAKALSENLQKTKPDNAAGQAVDGQGETSSDSAQTEEPADSDKPVEPTAETIAEPAACEENPDAAIQQPAQETDELLACADDTEGASQETKAAANPEPAVQADAVQTVAQPMQGNLGLGPSTAIRSAAVEDTCTAPAMLSGSMFMPQPAGLKPAAPDANKTESSAAPAVKPKKKKERKLSVREELERDSMLIERERRKEKRLNSPNELTPAAIVHQNPELAEQAALCDELSPCTQDFLRPTQPDVKLQPGKQKAASKPARAGLGPQGRTPGTLPLPEQVPLVAKRSPERHNRPRVNVVNEQRAKAKQALDSLSLLDRLTVLMPGIDAEAVAKLAHEAQQVLDREVPLGVTMSISGEQVLFESDVFGPDDLQLLCQHPCCDTHSTGALILTDTLFETVETAIRKVATEAADDVVRKNAPDITENVTLRDPAQPNQGRQSDYVDAAQAIEVFVDQLRVGYGDLISPTYSVRENTAYVGTAPTLTLIRNKWPYLTATSLRRAMSDARITRDGQYISLQIG